jgi:hypothetical protein
MYSKHIRGVANNLGEHSYPLILAVMKRVLWTIHKDWLSLRMLMKIEKPNYSLLTHALATLNKSSNSYNLRNEPLINFFRFILIIILIIFSALFSVLEVTNEHSVHISSQEGSSIISKDHSIWVYHGNYFEYKLLTKGSRIWVLWEECFHKAMNHPTWMSFTWMHSSLNHNDLFLVKAHRCRILEISYRQDRYVKTWERLAESLTV